VSTTRFAFAFLSTFPTLRGRRVVRHLEGLRKGALADEQLRRPPLERPGARWIAVMPAAAIRIIIIIIKRWLIDLMVRGRRFSLKPSMGPFLSRQAS